MHITLVDIYKLILKITGEGIIFKIYTLHCFSLHLSIIDVMQLFQISGTVLMRGYIAGNVYNYAC